MAERLALPTSDHGVVGSNPAGGEIFLEPKRRFIAQSLSCSHFHRLEMTEILLKGLKTLTHPSIHRRVFVLLIIDYSTKNGALVNSRKCASEIVYFRSNPYRKQCELMC